MNNDEIHFGKGAIDKPEDFLQPKAWKHEEIAAAFQPAQWIEKDPKDFITYPKRNQGGQSSCVSYTLAKQLAVDELSENGQYRELSPRSIYSYTALPQGGSSSLTASKLAVKQGMTLEALLQTDGLTEADVKTDKGYVTDAKQIALVYKPGSFIECASDFETIASIINGYRMQGQKKVVGITVIGSNNGTWLSAFPKKPIASQQFWYHRVPVTDFGLIKGKKYISIDNSWGTSPGIAGQQFLDEEYMPFMYGAIYTLNQPDNWQQLGTSTISPPKYQWNTDMEVGSIGQDVEMLQLALQSLGMFPVSTVIKPSGYFGGLTKASVVLFQASFGIQQTGIVGPVTRAKLNEVFFKV